MIDKEYKCVDCGHVEILSVADDWRDQHMYQPCPKCDNRVGLKMVVSAASIQRHGNGQGMTEWERIKNRHNG